MHEAPNGEPINHLVYDDAFASAGMPNAAFIEKLGRDGVDVVINVAPPGASGSLEDEADLVAAAQMAYLNIAVDWNEPSQNQVEQFLDYMKMQQGKRVFLHCQMNMRATAFAMLHRVINQGIDPAKALADMHTIWEPNRTWAQLINLALDNHSVDFAIAVPEETAD